MALIFITYKLSDKLVSVYNKSCSTLKYFAKIFIASYISMLAKLRFFIVKNQKFIEFNGFMLLSAVCTFFGDFSISFVKIGIILGREFHNFLTCTTRIRFFISKNLRLL
jgi:hypothetical protein